MSITSEIILRRLTNFAQNSRKLTIQLPVNTYNKIYANQIIRSSSSPGANYIEAIDASSAKEFVLRLKICRKEIKETDYWLILIQDSNSTNKFVIHEIVKLRSEASELIRIFTYSIITSEKNQKIAKIRK